MTQSGTKVEEKPFGSGVNKLKLSKSVFHSDSNS